MEWDTAQGTPSSAPPAGALPIAKGIPSGTEN